MDCQTFKNAVMIAKSELKDAVAHKIAMTRERTAYKFKTRGTVPENERQGWFQITDSERSNSKYVIRHLHLAYGYLRGQNYKRMEPHAKNKPSALVIVCNLERWLRKNQEHCNEATIKGWLEGAPSSFSRPAKPVIEEVAA